MLPGLNQRCMLRLPRLCLVPQPSASDAHLSGPPRPGRPSGIIQWLGSNLRFEGKERYGWAFNVAGAQAMFDSYCRTGGAWWGVAVGQAGPGAGCTAVLHLGSALLSMGVHAIASQAAPANTRLPANAPRSPAQITSRCCARRRLG